MVIRGDRIGQLVSGRYQLQALLGRGAMAEVYRADDHRTGRAVALKILRQSVVRDTEAVERFKREADVQTRVCHRNVAQVYGRGITAAAEPYLVFELLRGRSLRTVLRREGRIAAARAADYCAQALLGLSAVHTLGIHHRDLKPANLMLEPGDCAADPDDDALPAPGRGTDGRSTEGDRVVLIDFGFAAFAGARKLTRQGFVVGSLSYMAPERLRGEPCDERAELYSMAVIFYELMVGRPPFGGEDDQALIRAHLEGVPPRPSTTVADCALTPAAEDLLLRCLAKEPDHRPRSAHAMAAELIEAMATGDRPD
ncbi:MAG: serine/threonine-protein kinase [Myxococcota bacterium]